MSDFVFVSRLLVQNLVLLQNNFAPIAQPVEQLPFKQKVVGSIPTGGTRKNYIKFSHDIIYL